MISTSGTDVNSSSNDPPKSLGEEERVFFRKALLKWYRLNARDLPWRKTRDPYAILVSEMMLQQTQVATARDYYERFLKRFPTVRDLAAADETDVLTAWAGLGYYRRARLLHAAAITISEKHAGDFPASLDLLRALPGVGDYTAGALASFVFDTPAALVDANVSRVFARLHALCEPTKTSSSKKHLWKWAEELLSRRQPRLYNNALMELGALVCTPANPRCVQCPVISVCRAHASGLVTRLPVLPATIAPVPLYYAGVALVCGEKLFLRQISEGGWHAGMWEFPKFSCETLPTKPPRALRNFVHSLTPHYAFEVQPHDFRYSVTHHRITLRMWIVRVDPESTPACLPEGEWLTMQNLKNRPLPSPQKRIGKWVAQHALMDSLP
jgi:A/G-specific adenine glycosylase